MDGKRDAATGEVAAIRGQFDRRVGIEGRRPDHTDIAGAGRYPQRAAEFRRLAGYPAIEGGRAGDRAACCHRDGKHDGARRDHNAAGGAGTGKPRQYVLDQYGLGGRTALAGRARTRTRTRRTGSIVQGAPNGEGTDLREGLGCSDNSK